jgi:flavorubredoxin
MSNKKLTFTREQAAQVMKRYWPVHTKAEKKFFARYIASNDQVLKECLKTRMKQEIEIVE